LGGGDPGPPRAPPAPNQGFPDDEEGEPAGAL